MIARLVRRLVGHRPPEFSRRELVSLFEALRDADIQTETVERFSKRFGRRPGTGPRRKGYGLLRFDIHGNLERPLHVAEDLSALGMHGLFLTMHRHPVNEPIYDSRATWNTLRNIADLGHEIGLHFDPFYLIRAYGDLYTGVRAAAAELTQRGFPVQAASLHPDTRTHIKECGLQPYDFFSEGHWTSPWNGRPPKGEEFLADHVKRYSLAKLAEDCDLPYLVEPAFCYMGGLVGEERPAYLNDSRRQIRITNAIDDDGRAVHVAPPGIFQIPPGFARDAAAALKTRPFLALIHPQWYS